jgi:hypothetical protein
MRLWLALVAVLLASCARGDECQHWERRWANLDGRQVVALFCSDWEQ